MEKGYFCENLADWYKEHRRQLPWRDANDPYKIWLSEIILQQTRVAQGLSYYKNFIRCYPDVKSLARAREREVLRVWQGLGYYSRARNLLACARLVVTQYNARFPQTRDELKMLPGLGDYTAAAVASIAFGERVGVVDGNVYRVLARVFGVDKDIATPAGQRYFREFADSLVPKDSPGQHNQAIMEFGALHCRPRNPGCEDCIFTRNCFARRHNMQDLLPVNRKKKASRRRYLYYFLIRKGSKVRLRKRTQNDIWKNLYDLPVVEEKKAVGISKVLARMFPGAGRSLRSSVSKTYRHVLTHQQIHARFIEVSGNRKSLVPPGGWYSLRQIGDLPKPRLIVRFFEDAGIL